jgi:RNA polymerase sigma factor for flagellar operon FliA
MTFARRNGFHSPPSASEVELPAPTTAQRQLEESCQGMVRALAWKIHQKVQRQVDLEDLIGYGQLGLALAARDFDPSRGGQFSTYAWYRVRGAIFDGLSQMAWFSRQAYHAGRYQQMADDLLRLDAEQAAQGTSGGDGQLAVQKEARWLADLSCALSIGYLVGRGSGDETFDLVDKATCPPLIAVLEAETRGKLLELIDALPAEAGTLIKATYFEGTTLEEAGRRLGISKAWASRLHAKTLRRLAMALRLAGVAE